MFYFLFFEKNNILTCAWGVLFVIPRKEVPTHVIIKEWYKYFVCENLPRLYQEKVDSVKRHDVGGSYTRLAIHRFAINQ